MNQLDSRIRELLDVILNEIDGYLVDLKVKPNKVEVYADRDPHITIEDCARISRWLEKNLEEDFSFSQRYALEVSSPGMDQPLKVMRQYKKNVGRNVNIILLSGITKTGMMMFVDEEKVVLEEQIKKSKNHTETIQSEIPFVQIKSTNLVFNF